MKELRVCYERKNEECRKKIDKTLPSFCYRGVKRMEGKRTFELAPSTITILFWMREYGRR